MSMKASIDGEQFDFNFEELAFAIATSAGQAQVANLRDRLMKGIGQDDKPMKYKGKTYSTRYAKWRRGEFKEKPPGGTLRTDIRNLMVNASSGMIGSINVQRVESNGPRATATIAPAGAHNVDKAYWNQIMTPFIGVSPKDKALLDELAQIEADLFLEDMNK